MYGSSTALSLADGEHPWRSRWQADSGARQSAWRFLRPGAKAVYNSAFPVQANDGPAWTGRGMTVALQGGLAVEFGRLRLQVAPIAFLAQNQAFSLAVNGLTGDARFRDARFPSTVDAPQRFGDRAYGRLDPGNSTASLDVGRVMLGVSTAAQSWGPAQDFPLLLSANSGGFLHAFVATRSPLNLGILDLHARLIAGRLTQSDFSPTTVASGNRWASAIALVFVPHGADGLELGFTRFIEGPSERGIPTPARIARLFSTGLSGKAERTGLNDALENQLASVFARWTFPRAGVEVYGDISAKIIPSTSVASSNTRTTTGRTCSACSGSS